MSNKPEFGHALLSQFCLGKGYVNLNNGSFGALPRDVLKAADALAHEIESGPDKFVRRTYWSMSFTIREKLARLIGAHTDEVVMIPNTTHGVNIVLRNFSWQAGDVIIGTTTTYGAVSRTLQYIHDLPPHPEISIMDLTFPMSHSSILERFREHLRLIPRNSGQKVVAVIDAIVSNPGCVMPWAEMVEICREENVWSVVDAAHCIGQQVGIDLGKVDPDFWISSCYKWLYSQRGCAVFYVPRCNQHMIQSTLPTSFGYISPREFCQGDGTDRLNFLNCKPIVFASQFEYNGTIDFVPYLTVGAALEFRERLGGETRINAYCHSLAISGGRRLAQLLQTNVMDEDGALTANMVNVRLPLPSPPSQDVHQIRTLIEDKLLRDWNCFAAIYTHDGKWWTRCSVQIWNEISDFEYLAKALNTICDEVRNGRID